MTTNSRRPIAQTSFRRASAALLGAWLLTLPGTAFAGETESPQALQQTKLRTVTLPIEGICSAGLADIREGLGGTGGISRIDGSLTVEGIDISYAPREVSPDRIRQMITDLGYLTGPARIR